MLGTNGRWHTYVFDTVKVVTPRLLDESAMCNALHGIGGAPSTGKKWASGFQLSSHTKVRSRKIRAHPADAGREWAQNKWITCQGGAVRQMSGGSKHLTTLDLYAPLLAS